MLPEDVKASLSGKKTLDFGLKVEPEGFKFGRLYCSVPTSLVIAYALAIVTSGKAARVLMAGFDGYGADDPRSQEMQNLLSLYQSNPEAVPLVAVTPSRYSLPAQSIYAL
jgi:4-hydroxy 2-oxovalerate aldolase